MRLFVQLQAELEASEDELVCQAGLLEGELLTALVQWDIAACVDIDVDDPPEAEAVRQAVEAVDRPYSVRIHGEEVGFGDIINGQGDDVDDVPWAALSEAEGLVLRDMVLAPENVDGLIRGLSHLKKLRKVDLSVYIKSTNIFLALLQALPKDLEELHVGLCEAPSQVMDFGTGFPLLRCLRAARILDADATWSNHDPGLTPIFMAALPSSLEDLAIHMECLPSPCLVQHLPRLLHLERLTLSARIHFEELLTCVKALPSGLVELDLGDCCLDSSDSGYERPFFTKLFTMPGELAELMQRFTQLRRVACPRGFVFDRQSCQEAAAVLLALPRGLAELGMPDVAAHVEEDIEALEMGLRSFAGLKSVAFPRAVSENVSDTTAWERMFRALPGCLEHLELGLVHGAASTLDKAAATELVHLPNLKSVCFRNLRGSAASLAALPQTVESIFFKGGIDEQDVRALRARLTEPQLAQLLRTNINISVQDSERPVTSEMFKAWLASG